MIFGYRVTFLSLKRAKLLQLPILSAMIDIRQTVVSYTVVRGRVRALQPYFSFGTTFLSVIIAKYLRL